MERDSIETVQETIPATAEGTAQSDQDGQRGTEASRLDGLQIPGGDFGPLSKLLLRQTRFGPQTLQVAAKKIKMLLGNPLHGKREACRETRIATTRVAIVFFFG
jgi:hypothetical protein